MQAFSTSAAPLTVAERLRVLANQAARPLTDGSDPQQQLLAIARQLAALASELEHESARQAARTASGARPGIAGDERLWRKP